MDRMRCNVTHNLVGTDTWMVGRPCVCDNCQAYVEIKELRIALKRLLINYSAALPEGKKDQRSIAEARKLLAFDEGRPIFECPDCGADLAVTEHTKNCQQRGSL